MNFSVDKIAPQVAFVIVGPILILIGATGTIPLVNPPLTITEPIFKVILVVLGILLSLLGPFFVWRELEVLKSLQATGAKQLSSKVESPQAQLAAAQKQEAGKEKAQVPLPPSPGKLDPGKHAILARSGANNEQFVQRLSQAERVTILGMTNQNLYHYLEKALQIKRQNKAGKDFWEELRIVFLKDSVLNTINDEVRLVFPDREEANFERVRMAGRAKQAISYLLIRAERPKSWHLYEYDSALPFIGTIYEMPDGSTLIELATLRPYTGQSDLMYFEFSDKDAPQIVNYYKNVIDNIISSKESTQHDEVVLVGAPSSASKGFVWRHSKFRRSVLEPNPHMDDWIAVVMVLLWQRDEQKNPQPLLQVRTPHNATRELDTLSNIAGYINVQDCRDIGSPSASDVLLQSSAYENAVYRELEQELGFKHAWPKPRLVDEVRFYYPDKENLYFYVFQMEINFPLSQVDPNACLRPWTLDQVLRIRETLVLSRAIELLDQSAAQTVPLPVVEVLANNLILHQQAEFAAELKQAIQASGDHGPLRSKLAKRMKQVSETYTFNNQRRAIRGLAELQYREFFTTILPAYSRLKVPGAKEHLDMILADQAASTALAWLRKFYADQASIRVAGKDV